jgi:hypothetical protein
MNSIMEGRLHIQNKPLKPISYLNCRQVKRSILTLKTTQVNSTDQGNLDLFSQIIPQK